MFESIKKFFLVIKNHYGRYLWSSLVTFLAVFLPLLLGALKAFNVDTISKETLIALAVVISRIIFKAVYETAVILIEKLTIYFVGKK